MSEPSQHDNETRGLALSAFSLLEALIDALEKRGVLDGAEVQAVFDETLTALERRPHFDPSTDIARRIMEATIMAGSPRPKAPD